MAAKLDAGSWVHIGTVKATGGFLAAEVVLTAVVTAEDDDGVVLDGEFLEQGKQLTDLAIEHVNHGGVSFRFSRPILISKQCPGRIIFRQIEQAVGRSDWHVAEEGTIGVITDELACRIDDLVVGIGLAAAAAVVAG